MTFYEQIQNSIDYIEENLHSDVLESSDVSRVACMSVANFFRYFKALTGFTLKEYIRKRRLAISLDQLNNSNKTILSIALDSGFLTNESFSRAFKKEYGINPSVYKKGRPYLYGIKKKKLFKESFMGVIIKEIPEMKVAYYRVISKTPEADAWNHIKQWAQESAVFDSEYRIFGFNNPDPSEMKKMVDKNGDSFQISSGQDEYGYEFWLTVDDSVKPECNGKGVDIKTVPAGKFAVMSVGVGCEEYDIEKGWAKFCKLLEEGNYKMKERWFEEHLEFGLGENKNFRLDLYVEIE